MDDLNSEFEYDSEIESKKRKRQDLAVKEGPLHKKKADKEFFKEEKSKFEKTRQTNFVLDAYSRHKKLINDYFLTHPGTTKQFLQRDTSRDRNDKDVIRENHQFLWETCDDLDSWEKKLAKRYYDKLFKEYCIADLSRYKENKIAMRWRTQTEVVDGKGQFVCGARKCKERHGMTSWEVKRTFHVRDTFCEQNREQRTRDFIVTDTKCLGLCPDCSYKLNYRHQRRKVEKKIKKKSNNSGTHKKSKADDLKWTEKQPSTSAAGSDNRDKKSEENEEAEEEKKKKEKEEEKKKETEAKELWSQPQEVEEEKSREDEFDEFLDDLFL